MSVISHFIDGKNYIDVKRTQDTFNPPTGRAEKQVALADRSTMQKAIESARKAKLAWRPTPPSRCDR